MTLNDQPGSRAEGMAEDLTNSTHDQLSREEETEQN